MPVVRAIRESDWDKDGTIVKVSNVAFLDGTEVPGYDLPPGLVIGKELPDGWAVADSKAGKKYIKAPRPGGGGKAFSVAHRNSKEGQAYEQERMDRRTAAMQATFEGNFNVVAANVIYSWLRATSTTDVVSTGEKTGRAEGNGAVVDVEWGAKPASEAAGKAPHSHTFKRDKAGALVCTTCGAVR